MALLANNSLRPAAVPIILMAALALSPPIGAQRGEYSEYQVKAAFLINFAKFTDWPEDALEKSDTFKIGILGNDPFGDEIDRVVRRQKLKDKSVEVLRSKSLDDLKECHILFISSSERRHQEEIIKEIRDLNILTVGETDQHARIGGIVRFKIQGGKVRFDINVKAAERANLKISSKLLGLATIVK